MLNVEDLKTIKFLADYRGNDDNCMRDSKTLLEVAGSVMLINETQNSVPERTFLMLGIRPRPLHISRLISAYLSLCFCISLIIFFPWPFMLHCLIGQSKQIYSYYPVKTQWQG